MISKKDKYGRRVMNLRPILYGYIFTLN
ncbi:uncharacterized protein METZ01_LOCUS503459, partial [marine metagenome]